MRLILAAVCGAALSLTLEAAGVSELVLVPVVSVVTLAVLNWS